MIYHTIEDWNNYITRYPDAHILQSGEWGELKRGFGWRAIRIGKPDSGAQILFRPLPFGVSIAYLPKGPLGENFDQLWPEIDHECRKQKSIFLKIEPDMWEPAPGNTPETWEGFDRVSRTIQPRQTISINLDGDEETWQERMKQKTRYNINLAIKKGVYVQESNDLNTFHQLSLDTGKRDKFGVHSLSYFNRAYQLFSTANRCCLLLAYYQDVPLAGVMVFRHGSRAWYLYGASNNLERQRMPAYLLQWEAMRWAAGQGCRWYDLWGIPDYPEDELERDFNNRSDGLWGVYRFKRGFGGQIRRSIGAWDQVYRPVLYRYLTWFMRITGRIQD